MGLSSALLAAGAALLALAAAAGQHDAYSRFSVHGMRMRDQSDQKLLHELETALDLDVWQHGMPGTRDALVMVSPQNRAAFLGALDRKGVEHYLDVEDVAKDLEEFDEKVSRYRSSKTNRFPFEDYPRYAEVNEYLETIAAEHPDIVTIHTAGQSYEGLDIKYLMISTTGFSATSGKPVYFMDAMIHAREWLTTPVALYAIHRLVSDLRDEDRDLLEDTDWIIYPIVNPDGYEYTHTDMRLWRRTRSHRPEVSEACWGIDANRNFDASFASIGVSDNPCSDTYPGHEAFSEVETRHIRDIMHEHVDRIEMYLNIHSHGNLILFGFGDRSLPAHAHLLHHMGATMGAAMDAVKLPQALYYVAGNSAMVLYYTSGTARDYAKYIGIPFAYTLELPAYGMDFRVPPEYIPQVVEETWRGIAATARLARVHHHAGREGAAGGD